MDGNAERPGSLAAMIRILSSPCLLLLAITGLLLVGCGAPTDSSQPSDSAQGSATAATAEAEPDASRTNPDGGAASTATPDNGAGGRDAQIARVLELVETGSFDQAAVTLRKLLVIDPTDAQALFLLANVEAARGNLDQAVETLRGIPEDHPEAGIPALGMAAELCLQLGRYDEAEQRYRRVIHFLPEAAIAHRQLAMLLNRQGRRHEAAEHLRELCKLGDVRQDELHALIVLSDAMASQPEEVAEGGIDYRPIGASGKARQLFTERRYAEAAEVLRETVAAGGAPPAVVAFYGRAVAEAQDDQAFAWWLARTDPSVREFSEYWAALAAYLSANQQYEAATRALLEALDRDPTDFLSINRLPRMLELLGRDEEAKRWEQRWKENYDVLQANNRVSDSDAPNVDAIAELANLLFAIDRKLEAVMWKSLESHYRQLPPQAMNHWNAQRQQLVASDEGFPGQDARICKMRLDAFALPDLNRLSQQAKIEDIAKPWTASKPHPAAFANVAESIGLDHVFQPAAAPVESGFTMYQQAGGGVAVLDYDCDGNPDLYFAQGAADPPEFVSAHSNRLYRSEQGRLRDTTAPASAEEFQYTIGCTSGDWNQDGLPDLITANLGANRLLINNGDGTFTSSVLDGSDDLQRMPASVAIADLTGDAIPDLFEVNYIQDPEIAKLPARNAAGKVIEAVGPGDFTAALDRVGINDGLGNAQFEEVGDSATDAAKGLGVVIADLDGKPGNDVFVGNDKSANQLWVRDPETGKWSDVAVIQGNAFSYGGAGTASMGIAAADFDKSGTLDLHIANFQNESNCLYLGRDGFFQDRAVQYKLSLPSLSVLGFGSQALDYDNNGLPDLLVTNGHIDQYETMSGPFKQLPQLFANLGDRFEEVGVEDRSGYWNAPHLGRTLAKLDFDGDGKNDFVVTHLGEASALMINQTEATGHWLQIRLVGVQSERDAIGAQIRVRTGQRESTDWVIGGDGYLCRNEPVVSFGLGDVDHVDQIEITWPSGQTQTLAGVSADQRLLVIEGDDEPFAWPGK